MATAAETPGPADNSLAEKIAKNLVQNVTTKEVRLACISRLDLVCALLIYCQSGLLWQRGGEIIILL